MRIQMRVFAVLAVVAVGCVAGAAAPRTVFVEAGRAKLVTHKGAAWASADGTLTCSGTDNYLYAGKAIGSADVRIRAKLTVDKLAGSAASFFIEKVGNFGFSGKTGVLFIEGYGLKKTQFVGKAADFFKEGEAFDFEVVRAGTKLTYRINGKDVCTRSAPVGELGRFGFRPWRATMGIQEFSTVGTLIDIAEPFVYPNQIDVFVSGTGGHHTYRIPAVIVSKKGTVLAFSEGRKNSRSDTGDINLVLRRSRDGGKTWGKMQVVWDDKGNTCGNPCPVVDQATGTIWLLLTWNRGDDHESRIKTATSKDTRRVFVCHSTDDGVTWTEPVEITKTTKRKDWRWYATGPGVGIQLQRGAHKGRMVVPCDHSTADGTFGSHAVYSDDGGKTWGRGEPILPAVNECQVVELTDGRLMMNMRNYRQVESRIRAIATSTDGGRTWSKISYDNALPEPVCQASFLRYSTTADGGKDILLFSNPATKKSRSHMTVKLSYDEGKTWPVAKLLYSGSAAYSCLTVLPDKTIGLLYERDGYKNTSFARIPLTWLTGDEKGSR